MKCAFYTEIGAQTAVKISSKKKKNSTLISYCTNYLSPLNGDEQSNKPMAVIEDQVLTAVAE